MYHPKLIEQSILEYNLLHPGNELKRYPVEQVRFYVNHFEKLTDRDSKSDKVLGFHKGYTLRPDEIAFIENERQMCKRDFAYWAERYAFIEDVIEGNRRLIKFNQAQRAALWVISDMQLKGVPIMMLFLKARQLGVSTLFQLLIAHLMVFVRHTKAIVASGDEDKTYGLVSKMIEKVTEMVPWWLVRQDVMFFKSGDEFMTIKSLDNILTVQHGRQELGIARGSTANAWHFTELLEWINPEALIEAGFDKAVHPSKRTFGVEETTASARDSWLHKRWEEKERDFPLKMSMIRPVFLPWFVGRDIYPTQGFIDAIPVPQGWEPPEFVLKHKELCERYAKDSSILREVLPSGWVLDREQQWWYCYNYEKASKDQLKLATFLGECPASAAEAFQSRSKSIVAISVIQELSSNIRLPLCKPLRISGPDVPEVSRPSDMEWCLGSVEYQHNGLMRKWTLFEDPVFSTIHEPYNPLHSLWLWEAPKRNYKYCISIDCAQGVGEDRTVVQVIRLGTPFEPAVQVAEYASDLASAFDMWGVVLMLGAYYTLTDTLGNVVTPMVCPEDAADGTSIIREMIKWGWSNFYVRQKPDKRKGGFNDGNLLGWHTDQLTRSTLVSWLLKFIKERRIKINSPWLIDELRSFVLLKSVSQQGVVKLKVQHERSAHDDRLFALAIGIVAGHHIEVQEDVQNPFWKSVASMAEQETKLPEQLGGQLQYKMPGQVDKNEMEQWLNGQRDAQDDWQALQQHLQY